MSSSSGSGIGSNSMGSPSTPMQRDLEATAWTEINKAALGIVHDSIEKSFIDLNPRYTVGYLGGFGYRTTSENPLLDHPLESARRSESSSQPKDTSWQDGYQNMVNQLPPNLQARLISDGNKPFDQRNPSYVVLDNLLQAGAKVQTQTDRSADFDPTDLLTSAKLAANLLLPFALLKGSISTSHETMTEAQTFLSQQGANYPYFDGFNSLLNQLQGPVNLLQRVNSSLDKTVDGQLTPEASSAAAKASNQLGALRSQLERLNPGPDLQLLSSTVKSLEIIASALALKYTATAPLFIGLSVASTGIYSANSPAGLMGPGFQAMINQLSQGLVSSLLPANNKAGNELFTLMVASSLAAVVSLGSLSVNPGIGILPLTDSQETNSARNFGFETALQLAVSSGILESFYKETIAVSGGNTQAQDLGGTTLAQLAHYLVILSGSSTGKTNTEQHIEDEAQYLNQGIIAASELERSRQSEETVDASISLKLANTALESKDYPAFLEIADNLLKTIGSSETSLKNEMSQINNAARSIVNVIGLGNPNEQLTGIITIA